MQNITEQTGGVWPGAMASSMGLIQTRIGPAGVAIRFVYGRRRARSIMKATLSFMPVGASTMCGEPTLGRGPGYPEQPHRPVGGNPPCGSHVRHQKISLRNAHDRF